MRTIAALLLALTAGIALGAQVYTWKDASGKVHFSDTAPTDADAKTMRAGGGTAAPAAAPAAKKSLAEQELEFRKRRSAAEEASAKAEKDKAEAAEKSRNCEQAKAQLQALESGQRIARFNDQGERIVLDDAARTQETASARKAVESWCGK